MGALLTVFLSRCNNENEWYQIHENIIRKSNTKYSAPSTNYGKYVVSANLLPLSTALDLHLLFFCSEFKEQDAQHLLLMILSKAALSTHSVTVNMAFIA